MTYSTHTTAKRNNSWLSTIMVLAYAGIILTVAYAFVGV